MYVVWNIWISYLHDPCIKPVHLNQICTVRASNLHAWLKSARSVNHIYTATSNLHDPWVISAQQDQICTIVESYLRNGIKSARPLRHICAAASNLHSVKSTRNTGVADTPEGLVESVTGSKFHWRISPVGINSWTNTTSMHLAINSPTYENHQICVPPPPLHRLSKLTHGNMIINH